MLTSRGWSFLLFLLVLISWSFFDLYILRFAGLLPRGFSPNVGLLLISLTLALWFAWEWLLFALRVRVSLRKLLIERELCDERGPVETVWAKQTLHVRLRLTLPGGLGLPFVSCAERMPAAAEHLEGETGFEGPFEVGQRIELDYQLRARSAGKVRFEGLRVQLADLQGFFYHATFLRAPAQYRVLPPLADASGHVPTMKRHNLLPPPGVHRMRRPGTGSELLDLRDYMPGDPPKTIAWKVSARRDRLMTKEFESEVPVRCTLFVDTSHSMRLGTPGATPLGRLVEIASTVIQASASARDLTGLCLFSEKGPTYVRPARGEKHVARMINLLADAAVEMPIVAEAPLDDLLPAAYELAREVYPEELRADINYFPFWTPWLFPQPGWAIRKPQLADHFNHWLPLWLALYGGAGLILVGMCLFTIGQVLSSPRWRSDQKMLALVFIGVSLLLLAYSRLPAVFFPEIRRRYLWRKQLAALLSVRHGLAPGGLASLLEEDERMALHLQRFLAEHQAPCPLPPGLTPAASDKLDVLGEVLMRAVARGHDNELFVLMLDLLDSAAPLDSLLRAVKVTVARHHRVVVICPWPDDLPPAAVKSPAPTALPKPFDWMTLEEKRVHEFHAVRRRFARLGVSVVCAQTGDPARLILDRMERLRLIGKR